MSTEGLDVTGGMGVASWVGVEGGLGVFDESVDKLATASVEDISMCASFSRSMDTDFRLLSMSSKKYLACRSNTK